MGSADGKCHRVFEPRWYELGRWLHYLFAREKGTVTILYHGKSVTLRTIRCDCINKR